MAHNASSDVTVVVRRSDPAARSTFTVARTEPMMVLDLLLAIQREHDACIGFRFSCRVAMCGTCTLRLDGRSVLACQTPVPQDRDTVRLDPVAGLPVLRDLVVDTAPFWREWAKVTPYLVPHDGLTEPAVVTPDSDERRLIDASLDCIGCAACYSSCAVAAGSRDFVGPAALNRAMVLVADSRDAAAEQRLAVADGAGGVDRCHYVYGCSAVCPKGLDPAAAIRYLRKSRLKS
ncbi:MAG: succinate dehydrogenase/fumarate reductase iron-sulfur subunit [Streptosporangiales bacterium]|nr:succinate dehydrogenase/fumarate reductase iron-sulfur subunit [Streptosporangiales bacterium]MBO0891281.1 succinate dehydrogenase/fumarate reductase iron-sulfur subunit [Acidothermales bacterium]